MNDGLQATIRGIGVTGPGLQGWEQAATVLRGEQPYEAAPLSPLKPELLPPNERRRTTELIKLALQTAEEAQRLSGLGAAELACVFASAEGDTFIVDRLCEALTLPGKPVSPTQFHNSVHNAPAGYWAIAGQAQRFSTSIAAAGATFAAGLMEALAFITTEREPVLLVAYDVALPSLLAPFGDAQQPFALALVLTPPGSEAGLAKLTLAPPCRGDADGGLSEPLEVLRRDNPAAASLPLLQRLARGESGRVALPYLAGEVLPLELAC